MAGPAPIYGDILSKSTADATAAIQPALGALEAQKQPLTARYDSLIKQLGEQQGLATKNTETQTTRDFGARGISPNSGLFSQTLGERVQPIVSDYTSRIAGAGSDRENSLAQLASQIAGLQSNASQQGIQNALSLYGQQYGAYNQAIEAEKSRQFQAQQDALARQQQSSLAAKSAATPTFAQPNQQQQQAFTPNAQQLGVATRSLQKQGNQDKYVDINEAKAAAQQLQQLTGVDSQTAAAIIEAAIANSGGALNKYKW